MTHAPTAGGLTSWWPCDAAEHDRELIVELGEEFGASGPYVMRVLKDLAQAQRDDGRVRSGFRVLRAKTFAESAETVRAIIEHAARIGALDDLRVDEDGRRFSCRVSGWKADRARGRAALRQQAKRERDREPEPAPQPEPQPQAPVVAHPDDQRLCSLLAVLIRQRDPKAKVAPHSKGWLDAARLLRERDGRTIEEIEAVIKWCQSEPFWQPIVLSMPKLRDKFTTLYGQMTRAPRRLAPVDDEYQELRKRRGEAMQRLMAPEGTGAA